MAAAARKSGRMEPRIWQGDVLPGIPPAALESAAGELAFSVQIDPPRRHFCLSEGFPEIQQVDPAPVTEIPFRIREVIHFRLRIHMGMSRAEHPLLQRAPITPDRELCVQT